MYYHGSCPLLFLANIRFQVVINDPDSELQKSRSPKKMCELFIIRVITDLANDVAMRSLNLKHMSKKMNQYLLLMGVKCINMIWTRLGARDG